MKKLTSDQWLRVGLTVVMVGALIYLGWPRSTPPATTAVPPRAEHRAPPIPTSADPRVDRGYEMIRAGGRQNLQRSLALFDQVLKTNPTDVRAIFGNGWALHVLGELRAAEIKYRAASAFADGNNAEISYLAHHNLGVLYQGQGEPLLAIDEFQRARALKDDWTDSFHLGQCLSAAGKHGEAIAALDHARQLRPEEAVIHLEIGATQWKLGNKPRAAVEFNEAMRLDKKLAVEVRKIVGSKQAGDKPTSKKL
jgi:tetratricopeptide (TPR) repeat protein